MRLPWISFHSPLSLTHHTQLISSVIVACVVFCAALQEDLTSSNPAPPAGAIDAKDTLAIERKMSKHKRNASSVV